METIVSHVWLSGTDGNASLYELDYTCSPLRDGLMRFAKVHNSERPCRCPQRNTREARLCARPP